MADSRQQTMDQATGDQATAAASVGRDALASAADVLKAEVADADIGGKVGDITDKAVQSVTEDIDPSSTGDTGKPA